MKLAPSNHTLAVFFIAILIFSGVNTFLIIYSSDVLQRQRNQDVSNLNQALNQTNTSLSQSDILLNGKIDNVNSLLPVGQYDYVIFKDNLGVYEAKNGVTGEIDFNSTDAASVFNAALANGNSVYVKSDSYQYVLNSDIYLENRKNARLDSDGAALTLNGYKIIIVGDDYQHSQNNQISGFLIINGTLRIENSFRTTVTNMIFENSAVGIELANTNTWTEGTKIDTVHFNKVTQGIVFRTNTTGTQKGYSTGSYGNTEINRCYFNQLDNSVAITVESNAEFTDSQMQNVRIWIGEFGNFNQTGLLLNVNASMYQTLLDGVVFESFAAGNLENASINAVKIDQTVFQTPNLQAGVSFLGNWTARISNLKNNWITGNGSVFKQENVSVPISPFNYQRQSTVIQMRPQSITVFKPKVTVQGSFGYNETVTVRFRLEFIDNSVTDETLAVQKSFNSSGSVWLSDDDLMQLFPSENVVWAILVDAKVNNAVTDASVQVSLYGVTT